MSISIKHFAAGLAVAGFAGVCCGLGWTVARAVGAPPATVQRDQGRERILAALRESGGRVPGGDDWQISRKGAARIPMDRAMALTAREWETPAAGRSNLLHRAAIFLAAPPPPASTVPSI